MNKKILGIRVGTLCSLLLCLIASFLIWLYVGILSDTSDTENAEPDETQDTAFYECEPGEVL